MAEDQSCKRFTVQIDSALLTEFRALARSEGRLLQSLVEEAMANLLQQRQAGKGRAHVMAAYQATVDRFGPVFEKLADLENRAQLSELPK